MVDFNPVISIIALSVNSPNEAHRVTKRLKKKLFTFYFLYFPVVFVLTDSSLDENITSVYTLVLCNTFLSNKDDLLLVPPWASDNNQAVLNSVS